MNQYAPDVIVRIGGTTPGHINIPIGTRMSPVPGAIRDMALTPHKLIWANEDNNGSIIIIDQDTVQINGEQHKLVHPLKLNMSNLYCIWINAKPTQP